MQLKAKIVTRDQAAIANFKIVEKVENILQTNCDKRCPGVNKFLDANELSLIKCETQKLSAVLKQNRLKQKIKISKVAKFTSGFFPKSFQIHLQIERQNVLKVGKDSTTIKISVETR